MGELDGNTVITVLQQMQVALTSPECAQQVRDAAVRCGADNDAFEYFKHVFPLLCSIQLQVAQECEFSVSEAAELLVRRLTYEDHCPIPTWTIAVGCSVTSVATDLDSLAKFQFRVAEMAKENDEIAILFETVRKLTMPQVSLPILPTNVNNAVRNGSGN